jgi:hypothetical protein
MVARLTLHVSNLVLAPSPDLEKRFLNLIAAKGEVESAVSRSGRAFTGSTQHDIRLVQRFVLVVPDVGRCSACDEPIETHRLSGADCRLIRVGVTQLKVGARPKLIHKLINTQHTTRPHK